MNPTEKHFSLNSGVSESASHPTPAVNSFNEWDPLEEVIVGILEGAVELCWEPGLESVMPFEQLPELKAWHLEQGGQPFFERHLVPAQKELSEFNQILRSEGVTVRVPEPIDHARSFATPDWTSPAGNSQAKPRDVLIVIGNEILEAPMSWHSRYFEFQGYRSLVREYFRKGARWTAAPKAQLTPELYNTGYRRGEEYVTTEFEPVWDAADICRVGKDLFIQRSNVTNLSGVEWLRRHLGDTYHIHILEFLDDRPIHIDSTFVPLAPGKLMINPDRPCKNFPEMFKKAGWDILVPPPTVHRDAVRSQKWLHLNVLMLDERRVIVEKEEQPFAKALKDWGFQPILCPFRNNYRFGGSFYCSTVDIRRHGELKSYF